MLLALAAFVLVTVWMSIQVRSGQQFSYLAQAFAHGQLSFLQEPSNWFDTTPYEGRHYWPLGPLPAVLLLPFAFLFGLLDAFFYQGYLQPLLVVLVLALVYRVARQIGYDRDDGAYLAFGFTFATAFLGVAMLPWSWYFSQVLTCALIFGAITEVLGQRRPLVVGTLFGLVLATRVTAALGIAWPAVLILLGQDVPRKKLRELALLGLPCLVVLGLLLLYNHARFGSIFEQGYAQQIIPPHAAAGRAMGIFSLVHLPGNLFHLLLSAPQTVRLDRTSMVLKFPYVMANPWGMSLFLTSPCFLYLFTMRLGDLASRLLLGTAALIAVPILLYYGIGFRQFGYRYALDFLPYVYVVLMRNYKESRGGLGWGFRGLLLGSAAVNLYLFLAHFVPVVRQ